MRHLRPEEILETNGGILYGSQLKSKILDTQPRETRYDALDLIGREPLWFYRNLRQGKTSQPSPDPDGVEKMGENPPEQG